MSTGASGNANDAGMTPTTVVGTPLSVTDADDARIGAVAADPQAVREHGRRRGAARLSFGSHVPISGGTRSTEASDGVVRATRMRSAAP